MNAKEQRRQNLERYNLIRTTTQTFFVQCSNEEKQKIECRGVGEEGGPFGESKLGGMREDWRRGRERERERRVLPLLNRGAGDEVGKLIMCACNPTGPLDPGACEGIDASRAGSCALPFGVDPSAGSAVPGLMYAGPTSLRPISTCSG